MKKMRRTFVCACVALVAAVAFAAPQSDEALSPSTELKMTAGTTSGGRPPPKLKTAWEKFKELYRLS